MTMMMIWMTYDLFLFSISLFSLPTAVVESKDKVHLQHTLQLIKALNELEVAGGIIHETQLYVDEGHSLKNVLYHLYSTMDAFFERCFYDKAWGRIDRKSKKRKDSSR